ncbi:unnamed protein product, partial [marine sediment metagenome]
RNGFFNYENEYYCNYLYNRSLEDVNLTDYHEMCHYLIYKDYDHFCTTGRGEDKGE